MDAFYALLIAWGYWGMAAAAFIAGSVFPFSSETILAALQLAGLDAWKLFLFATVGNVMGSMFTYSVGRMGNLDWITRYCHVKPAQLEKSRRFVTRHGTWIGFFSFIPIFGNAMVVTMGLMRTNPIITLLSIAAGKVARYAVLMYVIAQV